MVWLRSLGVGKYEAAFRENDIDETVVPKLTAEDLKSLASPHQGTAASSLSQPSRQLRSGAGRLFRLKTALWRRRFGALRIGGRADHWIRAGRPYVTQ